MVAVIQDIHPKYYFYLADGRVVKNLEELASILEKMDPGLFYYHVNKDRNDFYNWIKDVFNNNKLASLIHGVKSKQEMARIIKAYVSAYHKNSQDGKLSMAEDDTPKYEKLMRLANKNVSDNVKEAIYSNDADKKEKKITSMVSENVSAKDASSFDAGSFKDKKENNVRNNSGKEGSHTPVVNSRRILRQSPDEFFLENPVLIEHLVEAKKRNITVEPLEKITITEKDANVIVDKLRNYYSKAYQRLSFLRKNGFDTRIGELLLMRVPAKIKMYEVTKSRHDLERVVRYLNEAIEEINNIKS